jgi:predicted  nucleic acid-binding Zn-ribbon protein
VKQLYQKVQQRAAEIQSELPQAKDPQQRQALIDEYQQLQEQVKELQAQMQGQSPAQEQLPAGPSAQKALPPGPSAQKAEIEEADAAIEKAMNEVEAEASLEQDGASDIKPVLIECHVCSATNVVSTSDRPTVVVCSSCGEQGYLTE